MLSATLFALFYFPAVQRFSRGLASPYAKVDIRRRLAAAAIDGLLVYTCLHFYTSLGSVLFLIGGGAYLLLRDAVSGQSVGKFLFGLIVIRLETGKPCNLASSAKRNAILLIPGANVAAIFLETLTIARDPQGQRLGDRIAQTQVVDGLGAKELVKIVQLGLLEGVGPLSKTGRTPVEVDR